MIAFLYIYINFDRKNELIQRFQVAQQPESKGFPLGSGQKGGASDGTSSVIY